ncbi:cellulose synthase [Vibrio variabilis]|uniref:Cellulose synthase n=1 Tax=Vibrio variabilis TaxID=990271 RepID=A0ABQ0JLN1_9VIBR|nr:cellulose synthase [Vibrio variabilis]
MDALWFSLPLAFAESCAFIGSILFTINLWKTKDEPRREPPSNINQCVNQTDEDRPLSVDVFSQATMKNQNWCDSVLKTRRR